MVLSRPTLDGWAKMEKGKMGNVLLHQENPSLDIRGPWDLRAACLRPRYPSQTPSHLGTLRPQCHHPQKLQSPHRCKSRPKHGRVRREPQRALVSPGGGWACESRGCHRMHLGGEVGAVINLAKATGRRGTQSAGHLGCGPDGRGSRYDIMTCSSITRRGGLVSLIASSRR